MGSLRDSGAAKGDSARTTPSDSGRRMNVEVPQTPAPAAGASSARPAPEPKPVRGFYIRSGDSAMYQPCGESQYYRVVGYWVTLNKLREQYRFTAMYMGRPLFAAVQGYLVDDTVRAGRSGAGSNAQPGIVKRFHVTKFDSMRVRSEGDCRGVRTSGTR